MSRPRLTLIDGHALAYRQFFGVQNARMMTSSGEPTGATYGFARTLLDLLSAEPPTEYLAVVFDQGMSGRENEFPDYKSTRAKMDDSLILQMERIRELVKAFNIPIIESAGYEADDVIGTLASQADDLDVDIYIITGDRDLLQLVRPHVTVELPPSKTGEDVQLFRTADDVVMKLGVRPDQIPDYKGLVGDSSDNIPGVKGVGEGTTVPLLNQYETLEGVYANLAVIKPAVRAKLEGGRESAFLSRKLATILRDLPLVFDLAQCAAHDFDPLTVDALFESLEFNSLRKRLAALKRFDASLVTPSPEGARPAAEVMRTIIVDDEESLVQLAAALNSALVIAFDTETTGKESARVALVGMSFAVEETTGYYVPIAHLAPDAGTLLEGSIPRQLPLQRVIDALQPALANPAIPKVAHNAAYDVLILKRAGIEIVPLSDDTMIAAWLIRQDEGESKGLKRLVLARLNVRMTDYEEVAGKGKNAKTLDHVAVETVAPYAAADAVMTLRLRESILTDLETAHLTPLYRQIEMPLVPIIAALNLTGALLDTVYLKDLSKEFERRLDVIKHQIYESVGGSEFNIASPKQLNDVFFKQLGLSKAGLKTSSHGVSVDADALETLAEQHAAPRLILEWRGLEKLKNTYVDALPKQVDPEGRVHTTYNQTGAVTGRISSDSPNLQNIPIRTEEGRRVRRAFIAPPGFALVGVDYSQIELRILAHFSQDKTLLAAFRDDLDIHKATAALVYGVPLEQVTKDQRYFAKRVNFGLIYGMSAFRLAREGTMSRGEAQDFVNRYFERLPGVRDYLEHSKRLAREQGYLETLFGRRRDFSMLQELHGKRGNFNEVGRLEREAINMPIQGTAADIIKVAMIHLWGRLGEVPGVRMILQVHDELVFEVPEHAVTPAVALIREVMEGACRLDAPLRADANVGVNWAEMQPVE
ncbi:MAG TPA: DNA polymerase I [Aggregatilineales bacterium]|nr:DNA polymerase I [Anaerolineales bacterium]HRE47797.1 DNA polymerase I [Aggregatilineales bacterium]